MKRLKKTCAFLLAAALMTAMLSSCGTPANVKIDEKHFPDEHFRMFADEFDTDDDGELSKEEISAATEIIAHSSMVEGGFSSFKGIEYLTELRTLVIAECPITELDVSKCTKLERLACSNGNLTELDVSKCKKLRMLSFDGNNLTEIDVSKCTKLENLSCNNNNLAELDVSKCKELTILSCSDNNLTELDVSKCTKLENLSCSNNNLTELDISNCKSIDSDFLTYDPDVNVIR